MILRPQSTPSRVPSAPAAAPRPVALSRQQASVAVAKDYLAILELNPVQLRLEVARFQRLQLACQRTDPARAHRLAERIITINRASHREGRAQMRTFASAVLPDVRPEVECALGSVREESPERCVVYPFGEGRSLTVYRHKLGLQFNARQVADLVDASQAAAKARLPVTKAPLPVHDFVDPGGTVHRMRVSVDLRTGMLYLHPPLSPAEEEKARRQLEGEARPAATTLTVPTGLSSVNPAPPVARGLRR